MGQVKDLEKELLAAIAEGNPTVVYLKLWKQALDYVRILEKSLGGLIWHAGIYENPRAIVDDLIAISSGTVEAKSWMVNQFNILHQMAADAEDNTEAKSLPAPDGKPDFGAH